MDFNFEQYATGGGNLTDNSMDVNNNLEFVEIHNNVGQHWLFYGAGTIDGDKAVFQTNGGTLSAGTFGYNPRISINDQRTVVATFRGDTIR